MSGDAVMLLYLGSVGSIFLLNAVQWSFYRDWIYGLFTLQTFVWFAYSLSQRVFLSESDLTTEGYMAMHTAVHSLAQITYLELVYRLFISPSHSKIIRWIRRIQLILVVYPLLEIILLNATQGVWQSKPVSHIIATGYWLLLVTNCAFGIWAATRFKGAVGWFFGIGSFIFLLHEANSVVYYLGLHTTSPNTASITLARQILGGGLITELLCFSLCLLFRQRQIAISQAITQTRTEEQLVQERLKNELAIQRLEREKADVQLRAIRAQINPHFLFNSLNSLSSLIDDEPQRASQFVDELSLVYRYLLKASDQPLSTLANELAFIQSYYHLLKTRHGSGLRLTIDVATELSTYLLPTLTLQLLIENAVKHNVTLARQPLSIDIFTQPSGHLTVRNTLQRKKSPILSNGIGLATIQAQYQKLNQPLPEISSNDAQFIVVLPLIISPAD